MLPDKEMLKAKLHELYLLCAPAEVGEGEGEDDDEKEAALKRRPKLSAVVRELKKGGRR